MTFFVRLPGIPHVDEEWLAEERYLNMVNGQNSADQRGIRRLGYVGHEPATTSVACAVMELVVDSSVNDNPLYYDIGANAGSYAFLAKSLFPSLDVVAFEPAPDTYNELVRIEAANRLGVKTEQLALSNTIGETTLYLSAKSDASNSLDPDFREHLGEVSVPMTTVDAYAGSNGGSPELVKIDVETLEDKVVAGAMETLARCRPFIVLECLGNGSGYYDDLNESFAELGGYHFYKIGGRGSLEEHPALIGLKPRPSRDWLVAPRQVEPSFQGRIDEWEDALAGCTPDRHVKPRKPRPKPSPISGTHEPPVATGRRRRWRKPWTS